VRFLINRTVACLACLYAAPLLSAEVVTITDVSGRVTADAMLKEWTAERITVAGDPPQETAIKDLLSVTFGQQATPLVGGDPLVILANGDRLVLRPVGVFDDVLTATWQKIPARPPVKLPLELVSAIIFDLPTANDDRQRFYSSLQSLPAGDDVILLANGDRVQGELERLDGVFVQLKSATGQLKLDRSRVHAIRMNPELTAPPPMPGARLVLSLRDGSHLTVRSVELLNQELKCTTFSKQDFLIPITQCVSCKVYGGRAIPLSDREPSQFTFVPYLSNQWPLARNANVLRGPLALRGVEYSTGLGVHSRSLVTYELQPADHQFRAIVGIDDAAAGAGSVRFGIELDGRRVWESAEIDGRTPSIVVPPVTLKGAKKLTLIVDFGEQADIADYADWCDAIVTTE